MWYMKWIISAYFIFFFAAVYLSTFGDLLNGHLRAFHRVSFVVHPGLAVFISREKNQIKRYCRSGGVWWTTKPRGLDLAIDNNYTASEVRRRTRRGSCGRGQNGEKPSICWRDVKMFWRVNYRRQLTRRRMIEIFCRYRSTTTRTVFLNSKHKAPAVVECKL